MGNAMASVVAVGGTSVASPYPRLDNDWITEPAKQAMMCTSGKWFGRMAPARMLTR